MNLQEADLISRIVGDVFYQRELEVWDVGVVTPYVAQVRQLKRLLNRVVPDGQDPELLEIASVDNFQGREKELIVFSAVRSNRTGTVGFLADWRRLNVMLTRARRGMVVCGNARTLRSDVHWDKWLNFYHLVASGKRLDDPNELEKQEAKIDPNETEEQKEARLKKERIEAARKLSMAIRFPGLAMAQIQQKERSRSRSFSPVAMGAVDKHMRVQGGRKGARKRTPSPDRKPLKVVKEVGIGRRNKMGEFSKVGPPSASVPAKPKRKPKVAIASSDDD
jgi:hypothetical protein